MTKKHPSAKKPKPAKLIARATSRKPILPVPGTGGDDIDGCDVVVTNATLDHELPSAIGGVD